MAAFLAPQLPQTPSEKTYIDPRDVPGLEREMLRRILGYLRPYAAVAAGIFGLILAVALLALVLRLYDPTDGRVLIDGHDLRTVELESLRAAIGVVTQEAYPFHATVLANLRYARREASLSRIEAAARAAQIHDLAVYLPDGYDTVCGDRGYRFSGGERQRLASSPGPSSGCSRPTKARRGTAAC